MSTLKPENRLAAIQQMALQPADLLAWGAELSAEQAKYCALLSVGVKLSKAAELIGVPYHRIIAWRGSNAAFAASVMRARQASVDADVDRMDDVARDELDVQRARLLVDVIKWRASKIHSQVYGDKVDVTIDQRVSVTSAREMAMARVLRPISDLVDTTDVADVAIAGALTDGRSDKESERPSPGSDSPDIFS